MKKNTAEKFVLTPTNKRLWARFRSRLLGKEGCNFRKRPNPKDPEDFTWDCKGGQDQSLARKILSTMPQVDVEGTLEWCRRHGGYCDCEIIFNCEETKETCQCQL